MISISDETMTITRLAIKTLMALRAVCRFTLCLPTTMSSLSQKPLIITRIRTVKVVVRMPPPVEQGEAPTNMRNIVMNVLADVKEF